MLGKAVARSRVERVAVGDRELGDAGVAALCDGLRGSPSLRWLDLELKGAGPAGCEAVGSLLATTTALRSLSLARNRVGDGLGGLAGRLPAECVLEDLDLSECAIESEASALGAAEALRKLPNLRTLRLDRNSLPAPFQSELLLAVAGTCPQLRTVSLVGCSLAGPSAAAGVAALFAHPALEELRLDDNPALAAPELASACAREVDAAGASGGGASESTRGIRALGLRSAGWDAAGVATVAAAAAPLLARLREVDLSHVKVGPASLDVLRAAPLLRKMRLFDSGVGPAGVWGWGQRLPPQSPTLVPQTLEGCSRC